jgi:RNA polymerase sigma-70 factor (ECF subfamily)
VGWRKSNEDAKDLTQAFFARLLQNNRIAAIQTAGGRFRSYLKQALKNFLIDADRAAEVRKPVEPAFALEGDVDVPTESAPDRAFDRQWLSCLLDTSIARLEADLKKDGKSAYFDVFRAYLLEPEAERGVTVATQSGEIALPTYGSVAKRLGLADSDVRNYLSLCRARLREILKDGVRETVDHPGDVEDELRALLNE